MHYPPSHYHHGAAMFKENLRKEDVARVMAALGSFSRTALWDKYRTYGQEPPCPVCDQMHVGKPCPKRLYEEALQHWDYQPTLHRALPSMPLPTLDFSMLPGRVRSAQFHVQHNTETAADRMAGVSITAFETILSGTLIGLDTSGFARALREAQGNLDGLRDNLRDLAMHGGVSIAFTALAATAADWQARVMDNELRLITADWLLNPGHARVARALAEQDAKGSPLPGALVKAYRRRANQQYIAQCTERQVLLRSKVATVLAVEAHTGQPSRLTQREWEPSRLQLTWWVFRTDLASRVHRLRLGWQRYWREFDHATQ